MAITTTGTIILNSTDQRPFEPTNLCIPSEYDHASHPELITLKRTDLERCIHTIIEETICRGGMITTLSRECMEALDQEALNVHETFDIK